MYDFPDWFRAAAYLFMLYTYAHTQPIHTLFTADKKIQHREYNYRRRVWAENK